MGGHSTTRTGSTRPRPTGPAASEARPLGGDGTPEVCEFAAAALGARIGRSPYAAARLMADALDLHHRLTRALGAGAGRRGARVLRPPRVRETRDLTLEEAAYVDAAVAESADGRIPWSRFEALVEGKVAQAAPEVAREKEERAAKATFAKKLRTEAHGMATFMVRADVATIDAIEAAVTAKADHCSRPDARCRRRCRRVHAVLLMAHPGATPETAFVRPAADGPALPAHLRWARPRGIARLEGHGPVTEEWVPRVLGPHASSRSPRSSTSPARHPSTPTRSPTDIDRPCT